MVYPQAAAEPGMETADYHRNMRRHDHIFYLLAGSCHAAAGRQLSVGADLGAGARYGFVADDDCRFLAGLSAVLNNPNALPCSAFNAIRSWLSESQYLPSE